VELKDGGKKGRDSPERGEGDAGEHNRTNNNQKRFFPQFTLCVMGRRGEEEGLERIESTLKHWQHVKNYSFKQNIETYRGTGEEWRSFIRVCSRYNALNL